MTDTIQLCERTKCTGCGACAAKCPHGAITMQEDDEGFPMPVIVRGTCRSCRLCLEACPVLNEQRLNPTPDHVYAAWSKDYGIRTHASSGGLYLTFAKWIIDRGGCVNGVAFDDEFNLQHQIGTNLADCRTFCGSKYVQASTEGIFSKVKSALASGKPVLFVSTPCQVAALYAYLGGRPVGLYTCDLVCHGVPSPGRFKSFVKFIAGKLHLGKVNAYCFRNLQGWGLRTILTTAEGKAVEIPMDGNAYTKPFTFGLNFRESCYTCRYSRMERIGDVTIGDFWRVGRWSFFGRSKRHGVSYLSINSDRGRELVRGVRNQLMIVERPLLETRANGNLHQPMSRPRIRESYYRKDWSELNPLLQGAYAEFGRMSLRKRILLPSYIVAREAFRGCLIALTFLRGRWLREAEI